MLKLVLFKSSLRPFLIRIVKIEGLLTLAFFAAATIDYVIQQRDICNLVSDVACTTTRAQNFLLIILFSSEIAFVLTHATAITVSVRAMILKRREEPVRVLFGDAILAVFLMPFIAAIFWFGWFPVIPHLAGTVNTVLDFFADARR